MSIAVAKIRLIAKILKLSLLKLSGFLPLQLSENVECFGFILDILAPVTNTLPV